MVAMHSLAIFFSLASIAVAQGQLSLEWDRNLEADVAGYVLYLGTAGGGYTTLVDVGDATSHTFSGLEPGIVYHCRLQAYNADGQAGEATPEVMFTLESGAPAFAAWAAAGGLTGDAALPGAAPHHDGVPNLLKYAFNLNPAGPDVRKLAKGTGTAGLPVFSLKQNGGQRAFTVEYLRRNSGGLAYLPQAASDLHGFLPMTGTTTVTTINADWERVVVEMPLASPAPTRLFGRVAVAMP